MTTFASENLNTATLPPNGPPGRSVFGANEIRLNARQWVITLAIFSVWLVATPRIWKKFEQFSPERDYRIPYVLSKDYWLYQRRLEQRVEPSQIPVLGDSVVWGEYVRPDGTLSHFLNQQTGGKDRFVNCGVNGLFPLAMEGLVEHYAGALRNRKVLVHCNLLWLTSPTADLSTHAEEHFNHSTLVPQFFPRIPCYRADANQRLSAVLDHHVTFFAWSGNLQNAYYDQRSISKWTLEEDENQPPDYPNAWRNPLAPLKFGIPAEPANDPQRGPNSPRHKPWNAGGAELTHFDWVDPDVSLQWQAFQRTVRLLRSRGNDVLVVVGPFNEHLIAQDQRPTYRGIRDRIVAWLMQNEFAVIAPDPLPTGMYADASHPLTQGYALLAGEIRRQEAFLKWAGSQ